MSSSECSFFLWEWLLKTSDDPGDTTQDRLEPLEVAGAAAGAAEDATGTQPTSAMVQGPTRGRGLPLAPQVSSEDLPPWEGLSEEARQGTVEALIFASEQPVLMKELRQLLGAPRAEINAIIRAIQEALAQDRRGLQLERIAGGYVFRTKAALAPWLRALVKTRPPRLGRASLETLAIIAYRQPATRAEVEEVRGVESGGILRSLLEKRLIRILGRKEEIGRPMIYGTTREFLQTFGLKNLTGLPTLKDMRLLMGGQDDGPSAPEEADVIDPARDGGTAS